MFSFKPQNTDSEKLSLQILKSQNARLEQQVDWLQKRVEKLTDQCLTMKKEGFTWAPPNEAPRASGLDDRIMAAIASRAKPGTQLERDLFEYASSALIQDGEIEDIVDGILAGREVE
jgi:hypothetical protein